MAVPIVPGGSQVVEKWSLRMRKHEFGAEWIWQKQKNNFDCVESIRENKSYEVHALNFIIIVKCG